MEKEKLVPVMDVCRHYNVEVTFINSLQEYELIEIINIEETPFIHHEQLQRLEKLVRLHYDLEVNLEGLDVINHLLQRIDTMHQEMIALRNKLGRFEEI
ncbi:MAG TPA: chaperone modulator CbpM [Chitinophagales bacterium]|nr:chaperone modulator CbpM [Chitinophagales bacterium]